MTFALRQSLEILQMPQLDLAQWLEHEIEKNPLLKMDPKSGKYPLEKEPVASITLHEHLTNQVREQFSHQEDRRIAFGLMELLDEKGFLPLEVPEGPVLSVLQSFDPPGIFARNLRETLLLQLKRKELTHSLAYTLVEQFYEELIHGRFAKIKKKLKGVHIQEAIKTLSRLATRPACQFQEEILKPLIPDLFIKRTQSGWTLEVNQEHIPSFHIEEKYLDLKINEEERETIRLFKTQAKWLFRSLAHRRELLQKIGCILVCRQAQFLDQKGPLASVTIKELAQKLEIHESTLSRALFEKYVATPRGILSLKSLITSDPESSSAKQMLKKLISSESKTAPLTDEELTEALKKEGFDIARRTVAKYRNKLKIGSVSKRKHC